MSAPSWLSEDVDVEKQSSPSETSPSDPQSTVISYDDGQPAPDDNADAPAEKPRRKLRGMAISSFISLAFLGLFIYSATDQRGRIDNIQWLIFYSIHATIPCMFLVHYCICFPAKLIYCLSFCMAVWSLVVLVMASLDIANTKKEGGEVTHDLLWDVVGHSVALFSALYHPVATKCAS
uniref:Uncharacterized protein n=1 Tax=Odontella aurita TaxID=265563 RepID=A0A7S4I684_9STRA|mmetsp:Transcript_20342/g.58836  ORF Transcript_20342/g.58836 Transcript_20342/m.58836 type:complete len:178 (+) Transcript_20342:62-595(+)